MTPATIAATIATLNRAMNPPPPPTIATSGCTATSCCTDKACTCKAQR